MAEPGDPVMIVVGGGAIALSTAEELCARQGHRVVVLWRRDPDLALAVESIGAVFITAARPDSGEGLDRAGVHHAVTILALSPDDHDGIARLRHRWVSQPPASLGSGG